MARTAPHQLLPSLLILIAGLGLATGALLVLRREDAAAHAAMQAPASVSGPDRWLLPALLITCATAAAWAWWWHDRTQRRLEALVASLGTANAELAQRDRGLRIFYHVINQAPVGICITDHQHRLTHANPEFLSQTGRPLDDWLGRDPFAGIDAENLGCSLAAGRPWSGELGEATPAGQARTFDVVVAPIVADDGSRCGLVCFRRDITAVRQAQAEARRRSDEVLILDKMASLGTLAAGIAHEINTPIQFIGDNIHFLGDAFADRNRAFTAYDRFQREVRGGGAVIPAVEELDRALAAIDLAFFASEVPKAIAQSLEGVERVTSIVKAMKDFSHPDAGVRSPMDLNQAIRSTIIVARNEYKYVADLQADLDPDLPQVPCFAGTIQQVLLNLIVNAAHAITDAVKARGGEGRGRISIVSRRDGDAAVITIADTGTGIPEHIRHRIFEPFFTTKPVGKGTGQGLNLSRQIIVQRHGGGLDFTSAEGAGTTFSIRLPLEVGRHV
jgi:PAS domain S-box-containing protein